MRTNLFLIDRLNTILKTNFPDLKRGDNIEISFGRKAKTRLGSIKRPRRNSGASLITINGLFAEDFIPVEIIDATITHELCHYVHGFSSPLPQLSRHPHRGGVINSELQKRNLGELLSFQNKWLKEKWPEIVKEHFPPIRRRRKRRIRYIWI